MAWVSASRWVGSRLWLSSTDAVSAVHHRDFADARRRRVVHERPELARRRLAPREAHGVERLAAIELEVPVLVEYARTR